MRSPTRQSIEQLAARLGLAAESADSLCKLLELLVSDPAAPTAIREPRRVVQQHFADALTALELEPVRIAATIADLGSGAGIPGLPLAIARPSAAVWLIESAARKCAFLERAKAECRVANVSIVHARVEAWREGFERFELVTARALAPLAVVVEYAAPLLASGGHLVTWRGRRDPVEESAAAAAAERVAMEAFVPRPVQPYPRSHSRHLHVFLKRGPTPPGFPRRPGVARKRPLGSLSHRRI